MWIPIIICLAAVALILGPILLMQPTPAQRRQASLRKLAMDYGLRVHLQPYPDAAEGDWHTKTIPSYCLPWADIKDARNAWVLVKTKYEHGLHFYGRWDWDKKADRVQYDSLKQCLDTVPERVIAVSSGPQGLCCYWDERGGEGVVGEIEDWLKQASSKLSVSAASAPANE
ncbi:hypothetical protein [Pseudomaricurvus sp.]|uniref:hypothetical protein n=1 Tax=Pseudomaricurvus sp. TaxID=2004510 RepID=UPI003F6AF745